jgi:photosystem II stability/assembly factor-like uncharacterized protein
MEGRIRRMSVFVIAALAAALFAVPPGSAAPKGGKDKEKAKGPETRFKAETFTGLELRSIGPAVTSGRIVDIAVHPTERATWYVAVASGGVFKTVNAGTTWSPVFDGQGSSSVGCVTLDPRNPLVVWVGSGENNSQRSVGYGDGVYKSSDGGASWENVGLKESEHIGKIVVDPRDSNVVYVAAQGPLWKSGGDRGLYKTTDGGKTWKKVLAISDDTGVSDIVLDPKHPDVLLVSAYQRRRHEWTLINGGPESAIHKSTDGGATWKKLENGLPKEEMGRIGLAISPVETDTVFAVIEAANKAGGVYRSRDAGGSWEKAGDYIPGGPQYYMELFPDPKNASRLYSMDVFMQVSEDAGTTWKKAGEKSKHVDNHALWIDPDDTDHLINGCDGGVYESWDRGQNWNFKANLPITQFYKLAVDNAEPFYNVYGGTQDNYTLGGPSRTLSAHGITNADWFVAQEGDGFQPQVDPKDPNIVYAEAQHGAIVRLDRKTGERIDIQPQPDRGEDGSRWNWDSPLIISPHSNTRLYFASQRVYRSDDRGDSWRAVSPDLTRQIDRNRLKVMGRVWSVDSVAKNSSTSFYGNIVALDESPLTEGLLYAGTDDGLVQVSSDAGKTWRKVESFPGVPDRAYVARLTASQHAAGTVYAALNNHKMSDFKPYLLKSTDEGKSWSSIASDLPARGSVWAFAEDHVDPALLFAGTEFGLFFTVDGGGHWVQLKGKFPVIPVRDIALQKRENDLVVATFGRGFYVLDDYTPLRGLRAETLEKDAVQFPIKKAALYQPTNWLGLKDKAFQGESFYTAANPPFGAVFTYYLKDEILTQKKIRQKAEQETIKKAGDVFYPTWEALKAEDREEDPAILFTVSDSSGQVVRQITGPATAGLHRVAWDLRYPPSQPALLKVPEPEPFDDPRQGPFAPPGEYTVQLSKRVNGVTTPLAGPMVVEAEGIGASTLPPADRRAVADYSRKVARLQRAVLGAEEAAGEAQNRIALVKRAIQDTPGIDPKLLDETAAIETRLKDLLIALTGDTTRSRRNEPTPPSISARVNQVVGGFWSTTSAPTATHRRNYDIAAAEFTPLLASLRTLIDVDLRKIETSAEAAGAPWTPGRVPVWSAE